MVIQLSETTSATSAETTTWPRRRERLGQRRGEEVGQVEARQDEPGLDHLGLEGQTHPEAGDDERRQAPRRVRRSGRVGGEDEQQDEQGVGDVAAIEEDGDGRDGQGGCGGEAGTRASDAPTARYSTSTVRVPSTT